MILNVNTRNAFRDVRGEITDLQLFDGGFSVTRIRSVAGAVRGNHFHKETHQFTYVIKGSTLVAEKDDRYSAFPGDLIYHAAGDSHAFKCLEDSEWLVFTKGPRAGNNYESDTFRLDVPLI